MSEKVSRLAVKLLRDKMFPALPQDIQDLFSKISDPLAAGVDQVPNIVVGQYQDLGANASLPMITVYCSGAAEGIVKVYRHLDLHVDIWAGGGQSTNVDGRRIVSTIYEYLFRSLDNSNWTGDLIQIKRCYEVERSPILFEPTGRIYHISNVYRVEALSTTWY